MAFKAGEETMRDKLLQASPTRSSGSSPPASLGPQHLESRVGSQPLDESNRTDANIALSFSFSLQQEIGMQSLLEGRITATGYHAPTMRPTLKPSKGFHSNCCFDGLELRGYGLKVACSENEVKVLGTS